MSASDAGRFPARSLLGSAGERINAALEAAIRREMHSDVWSKAYGAGRSLIAASLLLTLLLNDTRYVFRPVLGIHEVPMCSGFGAGLSIFCLLRPHLQLARWLAIVILALVVVGWRPRYTGVLHWWINFSFISSAPLIDGGEQAATVVTFFLIPLTLTDPRVWHWRTAAASDTDMRPPWRLLGAFSYQLARVQVAAIYLHAAVGKCAVSEWQNGTALYYWFTDPVFGTPPYLQPIITPLILNGVTLAAMNWGAIILEFLLFAAFFMNRRWRLFMFAWASTFHVLIALIHGLTSFSLIMIGALAIYLLPAGPQEEPAREPGVTPSLGGLSPVPQEIALYGGSA